MADFRRIPQVEGRHARRELVSALKWAVLAAAVWVSVSRFWPDEWTDPDEQQREQVALAVSGLLAVFALWALLKCLVHVHRWRQARRWERMLDDPTAAHLVPPLAAHVESVASPSSGLAVIGTCLLLGTCAGFFTVYGVLALSGQVAPPRNDAGEDLSGGFVVVGLVLVPLTVLAARRVRRWRVARAVERFSSDTGLAPPRPIAADVAARRALSIPHLDVIFGPERAALDAQTITHRSDNPASEPLQILYLRLFDNIAGMTRFLNGPWRHVGYVHLLRSATQVDLDEFETAEDSDSMASLFISTQEQLEGALARQSTGRYDEPRPDGLIDKWRWMTNPERGRYPTQALLCHGTFWKAAVDLLLARMDLVALDLSGYRPEHTGTRYELQRVVDRFPIDHVVLLAETTSDRQFLTAQVGAAWAQMAEGSPNTGSDPREVHVELGSDALGNRHARAR